MMHQSIGCPKYALTDKKNHMQFRFRMGIALPACDQDFWLPVLSIVHN